MEAGFASSLVLLHFAAVFFVCFSVVHVVDHVVGSCTHFAQLLMVIYTVAVVLYAVSVVFLKTSSVALIYELLTNN